MWSEQWYVMAPQVVEWCAKARPLRNNMPIWVAVPLLVAGIAALLWIVTQRRARAVWPMVLLLMLVIGLTGSRVWTLVGQMQASASPVGQADLSAQQRWWIGIREGRVDGLAERLGATGQGVDQTDGNNGATALISAVNQRRTALVQALLSLGADPLVRLDGTDIAFNSAWDAAMAGNGEVLAVLDAYDRPRRRPLDPATDAALLTLADQLLQRLTEPEFKRLERIDGRWVRSRPAFWNTEWPPLVAHLVPPRKAEGWVAPRRARVWLSRDDAQGQTLEITLERDAPVEAGAAELSWRIASVQLVPQPG